MVGVAQGSRDSTRAAEQLLQLSKKLANATGFEKCVAALKHGEIATFDAVWGSACALLVAALSHRFSSILVVVPDNKFQDNLLDDLATFHSGLTERFPACLQGSTGVTVDLEFGDRIRLLKSLLAGDQIPIMVANVQALMQPVADKDSLQAGSRRVAIGDTIGEEFVPWLLENGFHQTSAVELPGEFSNRGGILDVFAFDWTQPVRIELFDDEIESLRQFDTATQRSVADLAQIEITVQTPKSGIQAHFVDYVPADTLLLQVEPEQIAEQACKYIERSSRPKELHSFNDIASSWAQLKTASISQLATGDLGHLWRMPVESIERFSGDPGEIRIQVERMGVDSDIYLVARVEGEIHRVEEILATTNAAQSGRLHLAAGCVHSGFRITGDEFSLNESDVTTAKQNRLVVLGCDQLFQRTELRRRGRRRLGRAIDGFLDLRLGDLIVHLAHGIGRFRGLKMLDKDGQHTEHLELEFRGS